MYFLFFCIDDQDGCTRFADFVHGMFGALCRQFYHRLCGSTAETAAWISHRSELRSGDVLYHLFNWYCHSAQFCLCRNAHEAAAHHSLQWDWRNCGREFQNAPSASMKADKKIRTDWKM